MMTEEGKALLRLNAIPGLGPIGQRRLIERLGSAEAAWQAHPSQWAKGPGLRAEAIEAKAQAHLFDLEHELALVKQYRTEVMLIHDPRYPVALRELPDAPLLLYMKGQLMNEDRAAVAIVGTRTPSYYGIAMAEQLAHDLAQAGLTIVSGLARGIDSIAHRAALKAGGRTIAVLGSGLAQVYPGEHAGLAEEIAHQGAVISEFPMETEAIAGHFPQRNRLISGLSLGVVVVEAAERSGSLITAQWAAEQNRLVFALPGNVLSGTSRGAHRLIRDGAILIEQAQDVIEALRPQLEALLGQSMGHQTKPLDEPPEIRNPKDEGMIGELAKRCSL